MDRSVCKFRVLVVLWFACTGALAGAPAAPDDFAEGVRLYEAEQFEAAANAFERAVQGAPLASDYHNWLGKAYGRLAERSSFLTALDYARRTRKSFERAVELDGDNRAALWSLMQFYTKAPGFIGGSEEKAAALRRRIADIDGTSEAVVLEAARAED